MNDLWLWGFMIASTGVLFVVWGTTQSEFVVYRMLVGRTRVLWGDRVHTFYRFVGVVLIVLGVVWAFTL